MAVSFFYGAAAQCRNVKPECFPLMQYNLKSGLGKVWNRRGDTFAFFRLMHSHETEIMIFFNLIPDPRRKFSCSVNDGLIAMYKEIDHPVKPDISCFPLVRLLIFRFRYIGVFSGYLPQRCQSGRSSRELIGTSAFAVRSSNGISAIIIYIGGSFCARFS